MDIFGHQWDNYIENITADWKNRVTEEDVVLIAGDISWAMTLEEAKPDLDFLGCLPGKKIIIRGNHDYWWKSISAVRNICPKNVFALQNDCVQIDNYLFTGSRGWQLPDGKSKQNKEDEKLINREQIRLDLSLKSAQQINEKNNNKYKIVSLIHYPPFVNNLSDNSFTSIFEKYGVSTVVYGHIHSSYPRKDKIKNINGITYYLTSCDQVLNKLVEIEI